jgi:hypothetical protein
MHSTLAQRADELAARAESAGIDWRAKTKSLPQGHIGLLTAALATLLGIDIRHALDLNRSLSDLMQQCSAAQALRGQFVSHLAAESGAQQSKGGR